MTSPGGLSVLFDLFAAETAARTLLRPAMSGAGMSAEQYACYSILFTHGPISVSQFADHAHLPLTTASDIVRAMERRQHVTRVRDQTDRRAWLLELSPEGREAHATARASFQSAARQVSHRLGAAEEDVRAALQALAEACTYVARSEAADAQASGT
jgi:DNA-binding MarR family transcriptional regulator